MLNFFTFAPTHCAAGYTKSATGLTVGAGFDHSLKAFPGTQNEILLLSGQKNWSTDFSRRCDKMRSTEFDTSNTEIWTNVPNPGSLVLSLVGLLTKIPHAISPIDVTLSASVALRYAVVPCTTSDGNYAVAIGLSYKSGGCGEFYC